MQAMKLVPSDEKRLREAISSLKPEVIQAWRNQKKIIGLDGRLYDLHSQDRYCTIEGLLEQVSNFKMPVGLVFVICNEMTMIKIPVQATYTT